MRRPAIPLLRGAAMLAASLCACAALAAPVADTATGSATAQASAVSAALQTFDAGSLARIVAAEHGHAFWLVLWDLDCPYCMKSMQHIAARQKGDAGLRVITVATDNIDQSEALQQRLQEIGIRGPAWAFGDDTAQSLRYAVDPAWRGEKPRAYLYDANGVRKTYTGVVDLDKLKP